jgi:hypothetical protein
LELLDALEEEGPLLREKERAPRIGNDLARVRLDLGEVGIDGSIEREVRRDAPAHVAAEFRLLIVLPLGIDRRAGRATSHHRVYIHHQSAPHPGESLQRSRLREKARGGALGRYPRVLMPGRLHPSQHVQSPVLRFSRLISQGLERDADLDLVPLLGDPPARRINEIGAQIGPLAAAIGATLFGEGPVLLHAERVHSEDEGLVAVVVGPDVELDPVFLGELVAVGECCTDGTGARLGPDPEVERRWRVPHQDLGVVLGGPPVCRAVLGESGQSPCALPWRFGEDAVDLDFLFNPGNGDTDLAGGT